MNRGAAEISMPKPTTITTGSRTYEVLHVIGQGARGVVNEVRDEEGAVFALKRLRSESLGTDAELRFLRELRFCWLTDHPHIVRVLDFGRAIWGERECPFYVTKRYPASLRDLIKTGIDPQEVLPYFLQIVEAIGEAHRRGVWHRDIKPENILYDAACKKVLVADFGIAHFDESLGGAAVETRPGDILANRAYAAPEQQVKGAKVGSSADIFALGLILNEMFTGRTPTGSNFAKIESLAPDFAHLDGLVGQMISQEPNTRPKIEEVWHAATAQPGTLLGQRINRRLARARRLLVPAEQEEVLLLSLA